MRPELRESHPQKFTSSSMTSNLQLEQSTRGEILPRPQILQLSSSLESFSLPPFQIIKDVKKLEELAQGALLVINLMRQKSIKTAFFLDKSARPLALLVKELWARCLPQSPFPNIEFIRVRKEETKLGSKGHDTRDLNSELIEKLREHFPNVAPDGPILIVDEFSYRGNTLGRAKKIVEAMFPSAEVIGTGALPRFAPWWNDPSMQEVMDTEFDSSDPSASYFVTQSMGRFAPLVRQDLIQLARVVSEHIEFQPPESVEVKPLRPIREHNPIHT